MQCSKIINGKRNGFNRSSVNHIKSGICAIEVFKCFNGPSLPDYKEHFQRVHPCKGIRGNDHSLLLPKVKSEAGRKMFPFLGAKFF